MKRYYTCCFVVFLFGCQSNTEINKRVDEIEQIVIKNDYHVLKDCPTREEIFSIAEVYSNDAIAIKIDDAITLINYNDVMSDAKPIMGLTANTDTLSFSNSANVGGFVRWNLLKYSIYNKIKEYERNNENLTNVFNALRYKKIKIDALEDILNQALNHQLSENLIAIANELNGFRYAYYEDVLSYENITSRINERKFVYEKNMKLAVAGLEKIHIINQSDCKIGSLISSTLTELLPLNEYVVKSISSNKLKKSFNISKKLNEFDDLNIFFERWFGISVFSRLTDALDPVFLLGWSFQAIDQGLYERKQLMNKLRYLRRHLDIQSFEYQILESAIDIWFEVRLLQIASKSTFETLQIATINEGLKKVQFDLHQISAQEYFEESFKKHIALSNYLSTKVALHLSYVNYQLLMEERGY